MNRVGTFAFRVSNSERRAIENLAASLQRSQSDAVRFVVVAAARELSAVDQAGSQELKCDKVEGQNDKPG
jgi:hypothetical protein